MGNRVRWTRKTGQVAKRGSCSSTNRSNAPARAISVKKGFWWPTIISPLGAASYYRETEEMVARITDYLFEVEVSGTTWGLS